MCLTEFENSVRSFINFQFFLIDSNRRTSSILEKTEKQNLNIKIQIQNDSIHFALHILIQFCFQGFERKYGQNNL